MKPLCLGIDLGTSSVKALALGADGRVHGLAAVEYPLLAPQPGWGEQSTETWYAGMAAAVRGCLAQVDASGVSNSQSWRVQAIGLSGQMHGLVCLDENGGVLRPAILWADQRSAAQVAQVDTQIGREKLAQWTGNPLATGFLLPSWLWLRSHAPELARQTSTLLLPKDYLRYRLTGRLGSEPSDAAASGLFDPFRLAWSAPLLEALQIDPALLPPLGASTAVAGALQPGAASDLGLPEGIPVVYGGGDQACQALGQGVIHPGQAACTIGSGGQLFAPLTQPRADPQLRLHMYPHALSDTWYLMAATLAAGLALRWLRDNVFAGLDYQALAGLAEQAPPGAEGLFFLPHLLGERTPHMDPHAQGAFIGLSVRHERRHLVRAVMEGVVFNLRQGLELMNALGAAPGEIVASGGGTRHPLWLQLMADIFDRPVRVSGVTEAAALGAALLAGLGSEMFTDAAAACRIVQTGEPRLIQPDPGRAAFYADRYSHFKRLYPTLKRLPAY